MVALDYRQGDHLAPQGCFALLQIANGCVVQLESSWFVSIQAPTNVLAEHWHSCMDAELTVVGTQQTARLQGLQTPLQIWGDHGSKGQTLRFGPSLMAGSSVRCGISWWIFAVARAMGFPLTSPIFWLLSRRCVLLKPSLNLAGRVPWCV